MAHEGRETLASCDLADGARRWERIGKVREERSPSRPPHQPFHHLTERDTRPEGATQ